MLRTAVAVGLLLLGCADSEGIQLTATLVSPTDITLAWSGQESDAAGYVVEFATEPDGRYTILEFLPPDRDTFTHPDLMPTTPFYYRVRSFHGPVSEPVTLRQRSTSGLTASFEPPDGIKFTWTDNADNAEGYLLELEPVGGTGFRVVALIDPDATSFVLTTEPGERQASYRIRAFRYGPPSNLAHQTTGAM